MKKFKKKSMLTPKDRMSYTAYKISDIIGVLVGLILCAMGNDFAQNPVNEAGEFVQATATKGNVMIIIGVILIVVFGVMLYNLSTAKDELEEDLKEKQRIREVMIENNLISEESTDDNLDDDIDDTDDEEDEV